MNQLCIFGDSLTGVENLRRQLSSVLDVEVRKVDQVARKVPGPFTLFDVNLNDAAYVTPLKTWIDRKPKDAKVIFVTEKESRLQNTRAFAMGATDIVHRPVEARALLA